MRLSKSDPHPEQAHSLEVAGLTPLPESVSASGVSLNNPKGVLILSEGNFSNETGHPSHILSESKEYARGLIRAVNGLYLGSVTQDLAINQGKLYILSGLSADGIYAPFCAGFYPLAMLYRY